MATAVAGIGLSRLATISHEMEMVGRERLPRVQQILVIADNLNQTAQVLRNAVIFQDPAKVANMLELAKQKSVLIDQTLDALAPTITTEEGKQRLAAMLERRQVFLRAEKKFVEFLSAGQHAEATTMLIETMRPDQLAYKNAIDEMQVHLLALVIRTDQESQAGYEQARLLILGLLGLMLALGVWIVWASTRSITEPLTRAVKVAETVARGDLTSQIQVKTPNEIGALFGAFKQMNTSLVDIVDHVRHSADAIATVSNQIASGNADLSQRTEEQASNLQQAAASMEQLTATVKQNADAARQATKMATSAGEAVSQGGLVVGQVVGTMQEIASSSHKIADIISVIEGIAFQTNILALNAAVEAARAGEQGRGFAVVATEVRNLAQRSSTAAKEIKSLIDESVRKVEAGSRLVGEAGHSMDNIVGQVKRVTDLITEIGLASAEQSQGISEVGAAVHQIDQVTQQNAALVEESSAAAENLKSQAYQLVEAVAVFKLAAPTAERASA